MAIEAGADALETDLWISRDGHIVCHHDDTAERMAGDPRRIDAMSLGEIQGLQIRSPKFTDHPAECIPTLQELLDWTPEDRLLVLEIKDPRLATPDGARRLCRLIDQRIAGRSVVCIAFDLAPLAALKRVRPELAVGQIVMRNPLPTPFTELLGVNYQLLRINPFYVWMAHRRGRWVAPLDPDPHARLARYLRLGVDAILTADPAETRRRIERIRGVG